MKLGRFRGPGVSAKAFRLEVAFFCESEKTMRDDPAKLYHT
jgi:hypothetical protein